MLCHVALTPSPPPHPHPKTNSSENYAKTRAARKRDKPNKLEWAETRGINCVVVTKPKKRQNNTKHLNWAKNEKNINVMHFFHG